MASSLYDHYHILINLLSNCSSHIYLQTNQILGLPKKIVWMLYIKHGLRHRHFSSLNTKLKKSMYALRSWSYYRQDPVNDEALKSKVASLANLQQQIHVDDVEICILCKKISLLCKSG